jgi:hypothetical protein
MVGEFRASLSMEGTGPAAKAWSFVSMMKAGALLLSDTGNVTGLSFKLGKRDFLSQGETQIVPWTPTSDAAIPPAGTDTRITVECRRITILINGVQVASIKDTSFADGYVGMAQYGLTASFSGT